MTCPAARAARPAAQHAGGEPGVPVIGLSAVDLTSSFSGAMRNAGETAADCGATTVWQSAEGSVERQVATIPNVTNERVSAILIDPLDKYALQPAIARGTGPYLGAEGTVAVDVRDHGLRVDDDAGFATPAALLRPEVVNDAILRSVESGEPEDVELVDKVESAR